MATGTKETSETEWNNAFVKDMHENVHSLRNKWEEPECHMLLHGNNVVA